MVAGPAASDLLKDIERQKMPVAMFEYNVDAPDMGGRRARYWQNGGTGNLPLVMVNSGRELTWGAQTPHVADSYKKKYGAMLQAARAERAMAEVHVWYKRATLDSLKVQVDVTNIGTEPLDPFADKPAQVVVFLVEDIEIIHMTKSARAVQYLMLDDVLQPGQTAHLEGEITGEKGTNYNKSKVAAVLEFGDADGWDIAGGAWGEQGERPVAAPPTATDVPPTAEPPTAVPPTMTMPPIIAPTPQPTEAPPVASRFWAYLPLSLSAAPLGEPNGD